MTQAHMATVWSQRLQRFNHWVIYCNLYIFWNIFCVRIMGINSNLSTAACMLATCTNNHSSSCMTLFFWGGDVFFSHVTNTGFTFKFVFLVHFFCLYIALALL